ncbi:MAG: hypothetical protein ACHQ6T_13295 [Myxococcota bacterium]
MFRVALRLLLAAALGAVPSVARADVYRWVDDTGATHYATSRDAIPRQFRGSAEVIPPPRTTISNPSSARPPAPAPKPEPPAPAVEPPPPSEGSPEPTSAPAAAPATQAVPQSSEPQASPPAAAPLPAAPGVETAMPSRSADPRAGEIAQIEGQIERDRETLRQLISTPRWDSAELAADPRVREISERLPRLQAELAALRTEAEH